MNLPHSYQFKREKGMVYATQWEQNLPIKIYYEKIYFITFSLKSPFTH